MNRNKINQIKVMVNDETIKNFINKCKELGMSKTQFIEKISNEPIIFLDKNAKTILKNLKD